jgi:glycosyltransferase involved in cell wall biosynthesis
VQVRRIDQTASVAVPRDGVVVCIFIRGPSESLISCLRGVLAHTPAEVPIAVFGDDLADLASLAALVDHRVGELEQSRELLYLSRGDGAKGDAFAITAPADVVLLNSDAVVAAGWIEGLRGAAYADSRVASATALVSGSLPSGLSLDDAAAAVRARALKLRPRLEGDAAACRYVRRSAIELVGDSASAFAAGGGEADFAQRCIQSGLAHVLADDVLVGHDGSVGYEPWSDLRSDCAGALRRSLDCARRALTGLSVVVDARILSAPLTGTQVHTLELIAALARTDKVRLSVIVPDDFGAQAASRLGSLPGVALTSYTEALTGTVGRADVVHRPYQIDNPGDLVFLTRLADRLVITYQDLIGYHNPWYFASRDDWSGYRELTRVTLAVADRVLFFSAHTRHDALEEELVEAGRASVVQIGVDHRITAAPAEPVRPGGAAGLPDDAEVMLCIGNDYHHKNRLFALHMLEELQQRHDWRGRLVFAGPRVANGSSAGDERRALSARPRLAGAVLELGVVSDAEKAWLMNRAGLVVYPTIDEGFGLVPFEAADHGVPCMWTAGASLSELLPDSAASIVAWDVRRSADAALELLSDPNARERNVEAIRAAGARLTWDAAAARLLDLYVRTCEQSATPASALQRRYGLMNGAISEDAARLIGPGGALPISAERPLLALATHPRIGTPVLRALELGYRTSYRLRRWRRSDGDAQSRM